MTFQKPYPPDPITYQHYNAMVDALESRFGNGAHGFIRDRTRIVNSRGNIWERSPGNIQQAINDVNDDYGGAIWIPKGKIIETQGWTLDEGYPVYLYGAGMCWHDEDYGTSIRFNVPNSVHCIDIMKTGETTHFGGLYDMTLYPGSGDRDIVHLDRVSDWHMERVYMNHAKRHGLHVESTGDCWNLWVEDCLIENTVDAGIRLEAGAGAGSIVKCYFLNNYFYNNGLDYEIGALDGTTGKVRLCQFHNNQHFDTQGPAFKMYRRVEQVLVMGHIFYKTVGNAIDINDDGAPNKCERITIGPLEVDGQSVTPTGLNVQGYTSHLVYSMAQIFGCTGDQVSIGSNTSAILEGVNDIEGEVSQKLQYVKMGGTLLGTCNESDTDIHYLDISGHVPSDCIAVELRVLRTGGTGTLEAYPDEGTQHWSVNSILGSHLFNIQSQRIKYSQSVSGASFSFYGYGYWRDLHQ